jgi:hypothetical protein
MTMTLEQVRDELRRAHTGPYTQGFHRWADAIDAHLSAQAKVRVTDEDVDRACDVYDDHYTAEVLSSGVGSDNHSQALRAALESFAARLSQDAQAKVDDNEGFISRVVHKDENGWWFWDETEADRCGPYDSRDKAVFELGMYAARLSQGAQGEAMPAFWAAVSDDGEIVVSYSADDGNNGEAGRKECNDYINDALLNDRALLHLVPLYTHRAERAAVPDVLVGIVNSRIESLHQLRDDVACGADMATIRSRVQAIADDLRYALTAAPQPAGEARVVDECGHDWEMSNTKPPFDTCIHCGARRDSKSHAPLAAPTLAGKEG